MHSACGVPPCPPARASVPWWSLHWRRRCSTAQDRRRPQPLLLEASRLAEGHWAWTRLVLAWNADGQGQRQRPGQGQGQRQRHKQGSGQVEWSAPEWWPQQDAHTSPSAIDSCGRPSAASAPQADPSTNSSSSVAASAAASTQWNTDSQGQRQRPGQGQGQRQRHKQGSGQGRWPAPGWWPEQDAHTSPSAIDSTNSSPSIVGAAAAAPSSSSSSCPAPTGSACVLDQQLVAADTDPHLVGRRSVAACSCTSTRDLLVADQRS